MQKRGQVTIFIIIGLILIIFVGLFFGSTFLEHRRIETEKQVSTHTTLKSCIENIVLDGISFLSMKGGFYGFPKYYLEYAVEGEPLTLIIPYYYMDEKNIALQKVEIEEQFEEYILAKAESCSESISLVTLRQQKKPEATVTITEKSIEVQYDSALAQIEDEMVITINPIYLSIPSSYYEAYTTATAIAQEQNSRGMSFCLTCLTKYQEKEGINNIKIEEFAFSPHYAIIYGINFTEKSTGNDIIFLFAGRYNLSGTLPEFYLYPIQDQTINIGYLFEYQVKASGENIIFSDDTVLFDIDATTGKISFYADKDNVGLHLIEITAKDIYNTTQTALFYLNITELAEPPLLQVIGYHQAKAEEPFTFVVSAISEETVYFSDDTPLFDIGLTTGTISFTPTAEQEGTYNITITATTEKGGIAREAMVLIIY